MQVPTLQPSADVRPCRPICHLSPLQPGANPSTSCRPFNQLLPLRAGTAPTPRCRPFRQMPSMRPGATPLGRYLHPFSQVLPLRPVVTLGCYFPTRCLVFSQIRCSFSRLSPFNSVATLSSRFAPLARCRPVHCMPPLESNTAPTIKYRPFVLRPGATYIQSRRRIFS